MIYKFRIILDTEEDIFRDIEIEAGSSFEDFHAVVNTSFGFGNNEMASFYISNDDWEQGEEIMLFGMNEDSTKELIMSETLLSDVAQKENDKLIYIYDFFRLWTFYVTLIKIAEKENEKTYPNLLYSHGNIPESAPQKQFEGETVSDPAGGGSDDDMDVQNYNDFDFNENWN